MSLLPGVVMFYIVYGDYTVYEGRPGDRPPPRDVQVIVQPHPDVGWHTQSGYDHYVWLSGGRWQGRDEMGLMDYLEERGLIMPAVNDKYTVLEGGVWTQVSSMGFYQWLKESGVVLLGRTMPTQSDFDKAMRIALELLKGEKTGWLPDERRPDG